MSKGEVIVDGQNVVELEKLGISLLAVEDKIIVMHDDYKSGYECKTCKGEGKLTGCNTCHNSGKDRFGQTCKSCSGVPMNHITVCPDCKGKGGLLVIPETARSLPTTGIVVSMGPETEAMKLTKVILEEKERLKAEAGTESYDRINRNLKDYLKRLEETPIRLGARVIFGPHVGTMLPMKGNIKLKIMRIHEPLAVLFGKDTAAKDFIDYEVEPY